jgi:ligand-binding sensor domain-containing protein
MRPKFLFLLILPALATALAAQTPQWQHFSYGDEALSIAQCENTILIGTKTGLVRYNVLSHARDILNTSNSPLPGNWISAVACSDVGVQWIGTEEGLCRVVGDDWQYFNTSNSPFPYNRFSKILCSDDGTVWILSRNNGSQDYIYRYASNAWTVYCHATDTIAGTLINDITLGLDGNPIISYITLNLSNCGLAHWNGNTWISEDHEALGIPSPYLYSLCFDGVRTWVATIYGDLYSIENGVVQTYDLSAEPYGVNGITTLDRFGTGQLFAGSYTTGAPQPRLLHYDGSLWHVFDPNSSIEGLGYIQGALQDVLGNIWLPTDTGVAYTHQSLWSVLNCSNAPFPSNSIYDLGVDGQGRVWFSIYDMQREISALVRKNGIEWNLLTTQYFPLLYEPTMLEVSQQGIVWFVTRALQGNYSIVSFDGQNWQSYSPTNSALPAGNIVLLKLDGNGLPWAVIIAGQAHLFCFDGNDWIDLGSLDLSVRDLAFDAGNVPWLATSYGLVSYSRTGFTIYNTGNSGLPENDLHCLEFSPDGALWIGGETSLAKFFLDQWYSWGPANGEPFRWYNDLTFDLQGRLWAGTGYCGLVCFDGSDWTTYTTRNSPLLTDWVQQVATDSQNNLWINSNWSGVSCVTLSNSGVEEWENIPAADTLQLRNNPNPCNPSTTITYRLVKASETRLRVFNLRGQLVRDLSPGTIRAGSQSIFFDGKDNSGNTLSSGIYLLRLEAGKASVTRRMLLVK